MGAFLFWTFIGYALSQMSGFSFLHIWVIEYLIIVIGAAIIASVSYNKNNKK